MKRRNRKGQITIYLLLGFSLFIADVCVGDRFISTDFTDEGRAMFEKATRDELIKQIEPPSGLLRTSVWEVTYDPVKDLQDKANKIDPEISAKLLGKKS